MPPLWGIKWAVDEIFAEMKINLNAKKAPVPFSGFPPLGWRPRGTTVLGNQMGFRLNLNSSIICARYPYFIDNF